MTKTKKILTDSKQKWAESRKKTNLLGKKLNYNASLQIRYESAMRKLLKQMVSETKEKILNIFKNQYSKDFFKQQKKMAMDDNVQSRSKKVLNELTKKFKYLFDKNANEITTNMMDDTKKYSDNSLQSSLKQLSGGLSLNTSVVPKGMEEVTQALIDENVSVIKSIPEEYLSKVSQSVMRSISSGEGLKSLIPDLQKYTDQSYRKVKNIAVDQTHKAYNSINKQKMQALGVKKFKWIHSGGGQFPRKSHMAISGNIYSFDNLPLKGEEGFVNGQYPGQAIHCGCTMTPIIEFDDGEEI